MGEESTHPALLDDVVERAHDLIHRHLRNRLVPEASRVRRSGHTAWIWPVSKEHVDVVQAETFEGRLSALNNAIRAC